MYSGKILLGAAGFVSLAQALVILTNSDYNGITAGVPFEITWSGQSEGSTIDLLLKNGDADNQMLFRTIGKDIHGTNYVWTPETDIPEGTYNLEIDDSNGDINYSPQFEILNGVELPISSTPMPAPTATETEAAPIEMHTEVPTYEAGVTVTSVVGGGNTTIIPPMATGGPIYGNMTSPGIYSNSTMTSLGYVAPSTTASGTPPPAASTVVTAGAIRQAIQPLVGMLAIVAGIAFLF